MFPLKGGGWEIELHLLIPWMRRRAALHKGLAAVAAPLELGGSFAPRFGICCGYILGLVTGFIIFVTWVLVQ